MLSRTLLLGCALLAAVPAAALAQADTAHIPPRPHRDGSAGGDHKPHTHAGDAAAALRLAAAYQVGFLAQHGRYAGTTAELGFPEHAGVTIRIVANAGRGYSAIATSRSQECAYYEGAVQVPRGFAATPSTVQCHVISRS